MAFHQRSGARQKPSDTPVFRRPSGPFQTASFVCFEVWAKPRLYHCQWIVPGPDSPVEGKPALLRFWVERRSEIEHPQRATAASLAALALMEPRTRVGFQLEVIGVPVPVGTMNGATVRALCATNDDARILLSVRKHHHSPCLAADLHTVLWPRFVSEATHTITSLDRQEARQALPSLPSRFRASARSARATKMCSTTLTA